MTTIVIVDDQALIREGFRSLLDSEPDLSVIGIAEDGAKGLALARSLRPDVVVMDIRMPEMDGLEATRQIRADPELSGTQVLILTTYELDEYLFEALRAGASGFLLKDVPVNELRNAIRIVAAGDSLLSPSVTRSLIQEFVRTPQPTSITKAAGVMTSLTARELDITRLVAQGLTNGEIAEELVLSHATVKTHLSRILSKLDLRDRVQLVISAYEAGLVESHS
jgi:DNA-binding NarL/FixJ family response regulator